MVASNNDKFLILKKTKEFILSLENMLITFPKKDMITRSKMYDTSVDLLECIIKANHEKNKDIKHTYQIEAIAKISKLDFYLERAYKFHYISEKMCQKKSGELLVIYRMLLSWSHNES